MTKRKIRYTNFNFGAAVSSAAKGQSDWRSLSKLGPGYGYGNEEDHDVLNFIDNHDNQRDSQPYVVTYKDGDKYRLAVSFMLAWSYGYPRVMSSFYFSYSDQGPPSTGAPNYAVRLFLIELSFVRLLLLLLMETIHAILLLGGSVNIAGQLFARWPSSIHPLLEQLPPKFSQTIIGLHLHALVKDILP